MSENTNRKSNAFHRINVTGAVVMIDEDGKHVTLETRRVYVDTSGEAHVAVYAFTCWLSERMRRHLARFKLGAWLNVFGQLIPTTDQDERGKGKPPMRDGVAEYWIDVSELNLLSQTADNEREDLLYAIFTGNLTRDPDMRYTPDGEAVTNVSIASNYKQFTSDGTVDNVIWLTATFWGKRAEATSKWLKKGKPVLIEMLAPEVDPETFGPKMYESTKYGNDASFKGTAWNFSFLPGGSRDGDGAGSAPAENPLGKRDDDYIPF